MAEKGHCKHGEFDLSAGCQECIAERQGEEGNTEVSIAEAIAKWGGAGDVQMRQEVIDKVLAGGLTFPAAETAVALRPGEDIEAHGYFEEAMKCLEYAEARVIATIEDVKLAADDLSIIAKLKKAMEEKRKQYLRPFREQIEAIQDTYTYLMSPVLEADKITRDKMLAYQHEQARIRQEQEEINRKRMEAAEAEMKLKGELTESVNLVEVAPEPAKSVSTDMGTSGQRDNWKWEVIDPLLIPREYLVVDNAQLTAIARSHHDKKPIAGIRFYNEPIIAVRAR